MDDHWINLRSLWIYESTLFLHICRIYYAYSSKLIWCQVMFCSKSYHSFDIVCWIILHFTEPWFIRKVLLYLIIFYYLVFSKILYVKNMSRKNKYYLCLKISLWGNFSKVSKMNEKSNRIKILQTLKIWYITLMVFNGTLFKRVNSYVQLRTLLMSMINYRLSFVSNIIDFSSCLH